MVSLLVTVLWVLVFSISVQSETYYVAKKGKDTNPGTEAKPWKTIGKAAATLVAGDTVLIKAGIYKERVFPKNSGNPDQYITYAAYPGQLVTIDGKSFAIPDDDVAGVFDLIAVSYIKVSGLRVINSSHMGIVAENSTGIIFENNYTFNTGSSGISAWGCKEVVIEGNEVVQACNGKWQECLSVANTDTFEIKNNYIHHVGPGRKEGITAKEGSSNGKIYGNHVHDTLLGIYVEATDKHTFNIEVYNNLAHDNLGDGIALASELGGLLESITVYNNISYHNAWNGIDITACCRAEHPMKTITIVNNTLYNNGKEWGQGIYLENPQIENLIVRNNICCRNFTLQMALGFAPLPSSWTMDHNLIDGPSEMWGEDNVEGDPGFVDSSNGDFRLREGSPAIDAGTSNSAPGFDYAGKPRPQGAGFDIGAYEYFVQVSKMRHTGVSPVTSNLPQH